MIVDRFRARSLAHLRRLAAASLLCLGAWANADQVTLVADRDNTLYQDSQGLISNAQGVDIFAGRTDVGTLRRALVHFDLSSIPPGSTVTSVSVRMRLNRARTGTFDVFFHRALADWGEGTSNDTQSTGQGTVATIGDATWIHRFYPSVFWTNPGGDFSSTVSAVTPVSAQNGLFTWSGAGLVNDVQAWVDVPPSNFGWLVRGTETVNTTARRFDSSEASTVANRPTITVVYTPPVSPTGACCLANGTCVITTQFNCTQQGGIYQGDATTCSPNPCPQPTGACCIAGASCVILTQDQCVSQGGVYQGDATTCSPNPCLAPVTVNLSAAADTILYNSATPTSNALGQYLYISNSNQGVARRALIRFDLASIPAGATIQSATLRLSCNTNQGSAIPVTLHRVTRHWAEATSLAPGDESVGAPATAGDATWAFSHFNTTLWTTPGGDFVASPSATTNIGATGAFSWSGANVLTDVQTWYEQPATNHGWILRGEEAANNRSRRFDSRQSATIAARPVLSVTYVPPIPTGACCMPSGACEVLTQAICASQGGTYFGDGTSCSPDPCTQPVGACCLPTGYCVQVTASQCAAQGGTYQGNATTCLEADCPIILEPYVDALPIPAVAQPVFGQPGAAAHYEIEVREVFQQLHRDLPPTRVWGYDGMYPGPTIIARTNEPVTVIWKNQLRVFETQHLRTTHVLSVDQCLHGPDIRGAGADIVTHLHGGHVPADSDGFPDAAFHPGQQSSVYLYPNIQPAGTIWYHDHALGITRLNVMMGLAGFYLIRDDVEDALNLPSGPHEIGLAIQDRSFNPDGSLSYDQMWMEHWFGEFAVVNGKVWPFLNVDKGKYRFRLLNGSTSRTYTLALSNGATFWLIGTDLGLVQAPVPLTSLTIQPGERADVIIDFAPYPTGTEIILTNSATTLFPSGGGGPDLPNIMKFIVGANTGYTTPLPALLAPFDPIPESEAVIERPMILRKGPVSSYCPNHDGGMWMINDLMWDDITEYPVNGTTEIWSWINRSGVSHPMHMHLVGFQILDRQDFVMNAGTVVPVGPRVPPAPSEIGWKDTVQATPNQITRVIARFNTPFPGRYPYHCHILEHEDHEMMRQFEVISPCPQCPADYDNNGGVDGGDLAAFFADFEAGENCADVDGNGGVDGGDLGYFFSVFEAGGC